jgi:hypothetical protein
MRPSLDWLGSEGKQPILNINIQIEDAATAPYCSTSLSTYVATLMKRGDGVYRS